MSNIIKIKDAYKKTFFDLYQEIYFNKITEIDITLKTSLEELNEKTIAKLLDLTEIEVVQIMKKSNLKKINLFTFIHIMLSGSSDLCKMFHREIQKGNPSFYSLEDISYIYKIDIKSLKKAAVAYGKEKISRNELHDFFKYVVLDSLLFFYQ